MKSNKTKFEINYRIFPIGQSAVNGTRFVDAHSKDEAIKILIGMYPEHTDIKIIG